MKLVLIHLGESNATHLWENLKHLKNLKLDIDIVLILDNVNNQKITKKLNCEIFYYNKNKCRFNNLHLMHHDSNFRGDFWRKSTERFFALNQWHEQNPNVKIIHIESDNLLFSNFPLMRFEQLNTLAWLRHNQDLDSAAILYSPNSSKTLWLVKQINHHILNDPSTTDMKALNKISKNNLNIGILPSYNPNWIKSPSIDQDLARISSYYNFFGGIFDPAAIGVWLTGNDPRNSLGWVKRYMNHFNPSVNPADFSYSIKNSQLLVKYQDHVNKSDVYNIHVHSKQLGLFRSYSQFILKFYCFTSNRQSFKYFFSISKSLFVLKFYGKNWKFSTNRIFRALRIFFKSRKTELFD